MSLSSALSRVAELNGVVAPNAAPPAARPAADPAESPFAGKLREAVKTGGVAAAEKSGRYANLSGDLDASPALLRRLEALARKRGQKLTVTSGLRTYNEQQVLWNNRANNPNPVAKPGTSRHESGRAVDVTIGGRPIQSVIPYAELVGAGLRPLKGDPVHVELP